MAAKQQTARQAALKVKRFLEEHYGYKKAEGWVGSHHSLDQPHVLTGEQAANNYYGFGADAVLMWESGPYDWAPHLTGWHDLKVEAGVEDHIFIEPGASFCLRFYDQTRQR